MPDRRIQQCIVQLVEQIGASISTVGAVARARERWMREQGMFDPARLVFIDETWQRDDSRGRRAGRCRTICPVEPVVGRKAAAFQAPTLPR
jgi:hypothetical protein